jgi:hypothetical protein
MKLGDGGYASASNRRKMATVEMCEPNKRYGSATFSWTLKVIRARVVAERCQGEEMGRASPQGGQPAA